MWKGVRLWAEMIFNLRRFWTKKGGENPPPYISFFFSNAFKRRFTRSFLIHEATSLGVALGPIAIRRFKLRPLTNRAIATSVTTGRISSHLILSRMAGARAVKTAIHLGVIAFGFSYCWTACCKVSQINTIMLCRNEWTSDFMHFMITVRLSVFIYIKICHFWPSFILH